MTACLTVRPHLGAFVDGELTGARMLRVARHLATCPECTREVEALRALGDTLRSAAGARLAESRPPALEGLASSVISRTGAERSMSWRHRLELACESWQWAIVGTGATVATCLSTLFVSAILAFGPAPHRADSLAALLANLGSPAGLLFVYATRADGDLDSVLLQVENGGPQASAAAAALVAPALYRPPSEAELVRRLSETVTRGGRLVTLDGMGRSQRMEAEALLNELNRMRAAHVGTLTSTVSVREVRLVASTGVSARDYVYP